MNEFTIPRFYQLLETEERLRKSRKCFFQESPYEEMELESYRNMIRDQYFYQHHAKYLSLIKEFLEKKIEPGTFISIFQKIHIRQSRRVSKLTELYGEYREPFDRIQQQKDLEKLFPDSINYESKGFSDLIYPIPDCYWFPNFESKNNFEKNYRNFVAEKFREMQKYPILEQEETPSLLDENKEEHIKSLSYQTMIRDQYFYQHHAKYLPLIKDFLEKNIDASTFSFEFRDLFEKDISKASSYQSNSLDPRSKGFYYLIKEMYTICENDLALYAKEGDFYDDEDYDGSDAVTDPADDLTDEDWNHYTEEIQNDIQELYQAMKHCLSTSSD